MCITNPTFNGNTADFRVSNDNTANPYDSAYTSRYDLEQDIRQSLDPDAWDSGEAYEDLIERVTDHFSAWIDYTHGVWEGTDVPADIDTIETDDYWGIVEQLDTEQD